MTHPTLSLEETALLIIRQPGFVNKTGADGSILASAGNAWRYVDDLLVEVPWSAYEIALSSVDHNDWPPYTISFTISHQSADETVTVNVTTDYDRGMCEGSRGGNESEWTLRKQDGAWLVLDVAYLISWD